MRRIVLAIMLFFVAGCGDTINQAGTDTAQNKLVIKSAIFSLYSSPLTDSIELTRKYVIFGTIDYSGDPQGAILFIEPLLHEFSVPSFQPPFWLWHGNRIGFNQEIGPGSAFYSQGKDFVCVLTDPHGNDSNIFPMTLVPQ